MDETQVDALIDDLEASYEWREDAPEIVRDLLARLPGAPTAAVRRARLTLLGVDDLVRDRGAAGTAVAILEIRDGAADTDHRTLQARAERALSRLFRRVGDPSAALEHAVAALALDGDDLDPALRSGVRLAMADALSESGAFDDARPGYREALEVTRSLSTPWPALLVLNNWTYTELRAGDLVAAGDLAEQMQALAAEHSAPLVPGYAGTVAEVLHARGRTREAITMLRQRCQDDRPLTSFDVAGCWLTLAQIESDTGDLDVAEKSLLVADGLAVAHELHGLRVEGIGSRAELLAARGDHAGAHQTHLRFHAEALALRSAASEARAQTLHAMYEVDVARRESARYRQMSYRDPLTGLHNRRHVDEDLDRRLSRGTSLAVAMVDLDHFKAVNDTCSHEAGDAVLVRVATLLTDAVAGSPGACAARLGGEEFLLILPGADLPAAHAITEGLRRRIADHDWTDIAPGVPVTASTGLATTSAESPLDRADLLRQADTHLYAAKDHGRDRVEPSTGPRGAQGLAGP